MPMQEQVIRSLDGLSEADLSFLLEMIQRFIKPARLKKAAISASASPRIGILVGQDIYAEDYDFDEYNDEIAKMFGVVG